MGRNGHFPAGSSDGKDFDDDKIRGDLSLMSTSFTLSF